MDTGADVSVFPASEDDRKFSTGKTPALRAANGTRIRTFGTRELSLEFPGIKLKHEFQLAEVNKPILGSDFFVSNNVIIDLARKKLTIPEPGNVRQTVLVEAKRATLPKSVCGLQLGHTSTVLQEFPGVLDDSFDGDKPPKHGYVHNIPTAGPPVFARARRLFGDKLDVAKQEFDKMLQLGIIRPSSSSWSSPLHVVAKANGGFRPCGDYRKLNLITQDDRYPLPHIHSFAEATAGAEVFSVVDLVRGYNQIPMAPEDIPKTAIITPFGLFEFVRMPFGLKNAAQAFQRLMDAVLRGLDFVFV